MTNSAKICVHLFALLLVSGLCQAGEESLIPSLENWEVWIANAQRSIWDAAAHDAELAALRSAGENRKSPLSKAQKARFEALEQESRKAKEYLHAAVDGLKAGDSILARPGLLALGRVTYDEAKKTYQLEIFNGRRVYEDGNRLHPNPYVISFDTEGRILRHGPAPMMPTK